MRPIRRVIGVLQLACAWPFNVAPAGAGDKYSELLGRVPDSANVLMLADVEALHNSTLGMRERWAELSPEARSRCMVFPAGIRRIVVGARLDFRDMDYHWKVGLAEARGALPGLETVAGRERGHVDHVAGGSVVWTPRGFFVVEFPPRTIGFVAPADRQALADWMRTAFSRPKAVRPAFADRAVSHAERDAEVVVAFDLTDTVSPSLAREILEGLDGLRRAGLDPTAVASLLATVRGGYLSLGIKETVAGTLRIEFDEPVESLRPVAKELVLAALEDLGADVPDLPRWRVSVEGKVISLSGGLSPESTRRVMSLVGPLHLDSSRAASPPAATPTGSTRRSEPSTPTAEATRTYYRAVVDLLDGLKQSKGRSLSAQATWYDRYARTIDELPLLDVDPDMLAFGSVVSRTLREIAVGARHSANIRSHRRTEVVHLDAAHLAHIKRQEDAHLDQFVTEKREAIEVGVADIRKKMAERYKVDF